MVLHKIKQIELSDKELYIIDNIKSLKNEMNELCEKLIQDLYDNNLDVETIQDIVYYSGIVETVGRITVNNLIKNNYKKNKIWQKLN